MWDAEADGVDVNTKELEGAPEWPQRLASVIGKELHTKRKGIGWSIEQLEKKTDELGFKIAKSTISRIESSRNGKNQRQYITVTELLILASALEISPLNLLFPPNYEFLEPRPNLKTPPYDVYLWFTGLTQLNKAPKDNTDHAIVAYIQFKNWFGQWETAQAMIEDKLKRIKISEESETESDKAWIKRLQENSERSANEIHDLLASMKRENITPPEIPEQLKDQIEYQIAESTPSVIGRIFTEGTVDGSVTGPDGKRKDEPEGGDSDA